MSNDMLKAKEIKDRVFDTLLIHDAKKEDCDKFKTGFETYIQYKDSGLNDPKTEKDICNLFTMIEEYTQAKYPENNKENAKVA